MRCPSRLDWAMFSRFLVQYKSKAKEGGIMRLPHTKFQNSIWTSCLGSACALGLMLWSVPVGAEVQAAPWECTGFDGEAQIRCARTFTELQQEKIAKLEKDLESQQQRVQQLQQQVAQQASATAKLERKLTRKRSRWYNSPSVDLYPPFGLSLRFGRDRLFGGSLFYGQPYYYGPRLYGYGHRRWHRY